MYLDADDVHNWHVSYVKRRWVGFLTDEQQKAVSEAHARHHRQGTNADDEAKDLNKRFGFQRGK